MNSGSYSLFLGDLSVFCTREDLVQLMSPFGYITDIRIKQDMTTGKKLSYGFVEFDNIDSAVNVINNLDGYVLCGRPLRIRWGSNRNTKKPNEVVRKAPVIPDTAPIHISYCVASHNAVVTEEGLRYIFSTFGYVLDATIKKPISNSHDGSKEGYGFVHYPNTPEGIESAICAVAGMNNVTLGGVHYRVCLSINLERQLNDAMNQNQQQQLMPPPRYSMAPQMAPAPVPVYQFAPVRQQAPLPSQFAAASYYPQSPPQQMPPQQTYFPSALAPSSRYSMARQPPQQHITPVYNYSPRGGKQQQQRHYSQNQSYLLPQTKVEMASSSGSDSSYSPRAEEDVDAQQSCAAVVTPEVDHSTTLVVQEAKQQVTVAPAEKAVKSTPFMKVLPVVCPCCSAHSGTVFEEELNSLAAKLSQARLDCGSGYKHSTIDVYMDVMGSDDCVSSIGDY